MTARGRSRKFGEKRSYPFPVWNGLLEHRKRIGPSVWEFLWCLDRITQERDEVGIVNGGAPVKAERIARNLKVSTRTIKQNLRRLTTEGYLKLRRTPYGNVIQVMNSSKFGIWAPHKRSEESIPSGHREGKNSSPPEGKNSSRTKKTQQTARSKETPLYEKEGFSEFWKEYPRKEDKEEAAKVWAKIEPEEHPSIMAGLRLWKRSRQWQKDGGQFIVYAVRFLRRKRWQETPIDFQPTEAGQGQEREIVRAKVPA
jgi:DNA-binding IscR family transcriptional regulator